MHLNEYQDVSVRTLNRSKDELYDIANICMGLAGEAGETVDYLKKVYFHGHALEKNKLISELGDVLWYISNLAYLHEIELDEIAINNIKKLKKRYPEGFEKEKSKNREELK